MLGLLFLLGAGLCLAVGAAVAYTARLLTHPPRRGYSWALARNLPGDPGEMADAGAAHAPRFTHWTLRSRAADLPVWEVQGRDQRGPTVVVTHGWGESRTVALQRLPALLDLAARVILWDLPGHGDAPGICSLGTAETDDLLALIAHLRGPGAAGQRVFLYGSSMGAGISIAAAAAAGDGAGISGVIAEAPYRYPIVPARNVLRMQRLPHAVTLPIAMAILGLRFAGTLRWATAAKATAFDRAALAARLPCPLLVLHGTQDPVCPVQDGRDIAAAALRGRIVEIPDGDHFNLLTESPGREACLDAIRRFIHADLAQPTAVPASHAT